MYQATCTIAVKHAHNEPTGNGGTRSVRDPDTQEKVLVQIDIDKIASEYGPRAYYAKSRKTKQLHGLIVITAR